MKCANHPSMDAVGTCVDCGKGLCVDCASAYSIPICQSCNAVRVKGEKGDLNKRIILTFVFFALGFYFMVSTAPNFNVGTIIGGIMIGYIFAGVPWGWQFLNKITPSMFLFLSFAGWVIYFLIKTMLSFAIGFIVLPIKLWGMYSDSKRLKEINQTFTTN